MTDGLTRFATRGSHRLSYEASGDAEGIPVLALHDLLADRGQLRSLGEALAGGGFRLTLPDARGHGASPLIASRRYPLSELAADALAVADDAGLETMHVAAVGWGAMIALAMAVAMPERVVSLVLAAPYLPGLLANDPVSNLQQTGHNHLETLRQAASAAERGQTDRALDLFLGERLGADWRDQLPRPWLGAIRRSAASLGPLLAGIVAESVDRGALRRVDAPVSLLIPADTPGMDRLTAELLATLLPRARIETTTVERGPNVDWTPALARALLHRPS